MADARTVANRFLELASAEGRALTPMQVLKLVYIAHGWLLGLKNRPLIPNRVEAWQYGPVIPDLYSAVRDFGGGAVRAPLALGYGARADDLTVEESSLVKQVWQRYGAMSGVALSRITHAKNTPWERTYSPGQFGVEIDNNMIAEHYRRLADERSSRVN